MSGRAVVLVVVGFDRLPDLEPEAGAGPAEMGLQNLADVHAARHAERIEHDVDRLPSARNGMSSTGTIFDTTPLLPWRPAILSPGWILRFTATKTLTIFITPGGNSSPRCSFSTLSRKRCSKQLLQLVVLLADRLDLGHQLVVGRGELPPLRARIFVQHRPGDLGILLEALRTRDALAAFQQFGQTAVDVAVEDRLFVVAVLGETFDFLALDGERALVLLDAVPVEHAHFDDGALHARRHAQRGVAHVGGLFAEDGAQQLFFRRHRAFALGRDLADTGCRRHAPRRRYRRCPLRRDS